jgi:hypothetical protein
MEAMLRLQREIYFKVLGRPHLWKYPILDLFDDMPMSIVLTSVSPGWLFGVEYGSDCMGYCSDEIFGRDLLARAVKSQLPSYALLHFCSV